MSTERVTISLPPEVRAAAQAAADETGQPFSAFVADALSAFVRGRMIDMWIREYEERNNVITEEELMTLAEETGIPYMSPRSGQSAA